MDFGWNFPYNLFAHLVTLRLALSVNPMMRACGTQNSPVLAQPFWNDAEKSVEGIAPPMSPSHLLRAFFPTPRIQPGFKPRQGLFLAT